MTVANELQSGKVRTTTGEVLHLQKELGGGYEGTVFRVTGKPSAVKIFRPDLRDTRRRKLEGMIANPPVDPTEHQTIVWPEALVESPKSGTFLGYEMAYLDLDSYDNALEYAYQHLAWDQSSPDDRYKAALNLAHAVVLTHKQGHALGDMNHQNILITDGKVTLIDCDAFDVQGTDEYFSGTTEHPRYAPPGGRGHTRREVQYADRFGLAIHLFQLLMQGFHPFQARGRDATAGGNKEQIRGNPFPYPNPKPGRLEPHRNAPDYAQLPESVRSLFEDCFIGGKTNPASRPTPETWAATLGELYDPDGTIDPQRRARQTRRSRTTPPPPDDSASSSTARPSPSAQRAARRQQRTGTQQQSADPSPVMQALVPFVVYLVLLFGVGFVLLELFTIWVALGLLLVLTVAAAKSNVLP